MKDAIMPPQEQWAIDALAAFVARAPRSYSSLAVERSRMALMDTIGCMLFGQSTKESRAVFDGVAAWGCGDAIVVGSSNRLAPPWAAVVNGVSAHCLDYDDWDDVSLAHTSAVLVPAILAAATGKDLSGVDILDAHIAGVEVTMRLGEALNPSHYWQGWHTTSTIGPIGSAAAVCRLLGYDSKVTACALSLATSMAGGLTVQFGSMAKPLHAGLAAKAGVMAASLAASGVTGNSKVLEGPTGMISAMSEASPEMLQQALAKLGNPWAIEEYGMHIKIYPSCGGTHRIIDAAVNLQKKHKIDVAQIKKVKVLVPSFLEDLLPYKVPLDRPQALFSFPYCAAVALYRGEVGVAEFDDDALFDASIRDLAGRVETSFREIEYSGSLFKDGDFDQVTVELRSGEVLSEAIDIPYGAPPRFAEAQDVEKKFMTCVSRVQSKAHAARLVELLNRIPADWRVEALDTLLGKG